MPDLWGVFEQERQQVQVPPQPKQDLWGIFNAEMQIPPAQILKPPEEPLTKEVLPPEVSKRMKKVEAEAEKPREKWYEPWLKTPKSIAGGMYAGTSRILGALEKAAQFISDKTGLEKGGLFGILSKDSAYWGERLQKEGVEGIAGDVLAGVGGAATDIAGIMTLGPYGLPVYGGLMGAAEEGLPGAVKGATFGALTHKILGGIGMLPSKARLPAFMGFGAATTPGGVKERTTGGLTWAALGLAGGKKRVTLEEFLSAYPKIQGKLSEPQAREILKEIVPKVTDAEIKEAGTAKKALDEAVDVTMKIQRKSPRRGPVLKTDQEVALKAIDQRGGRYLPRARPEYKEPPKIKRTYDEEYIAEQNRILETQSDILRSTRKPEAEIAEFIRNEFMDGEKLRTVTNDVLAGKMTKDAAVKEISGLIEDTVGVAMPEGAVKAGGLAYGMKLPKMAKGINLEKIGTEYEPKKFLLDTAEMYDKEITAKRRGRVSFEESKQLADSLGLSTEELGRKIETKSENLDAYVAAMKDTLDTSAVETLKLSREYANNPIEENLAKYLYSFDRHVSFQVKASATSTDIARALSIHRRVSKAKDFLLTDNYKAIIKALSGKKGITEEIAHKMALMDMNDPAAVSKFIRESMPVKTMDKVFEVWVNCLLSGLPTQVVNNTTNVLNSYGMIAEKLLAATVEAPKRLVGKKPEVYFGEVTTGFFALHSGLKEGVKKALFAWTNEMPEVSKIEVRRPKAIKGVKGKIIRVPGRALITTDEYFKACIYNSDIHSMAYRRATAAGLKGKAKAERIAELIRNPDDAMMSHATGEMLYRTLQKELGKAGTGIQKFRETFEPTRWVVPFLRVSINIPKYGFERTPFNFPRVLYKAIKGQYKGAEFAENISRPLIGTLTTMAIFMGALKGVYEITGSGPTDRNEKRKLYDQGWLPYSVKIGDKYVSYARIEPLATILGVTADMAEIWDQIKEGDREDLAAKLILAFTENITNKTFMRGVSDVLNAISDPERHGARWYQTFVSTAVPTGVAYTARATDPHFRDVRTLLDKIKSRIPGLAETLPPRVGISGEPAERGGFFGKGIPSFIEQMVSPVWVSEEKMNDVHRELNRLDYSPGMPLRKIRDVELSPEEYSKFSETTGKMTFKLWDLRIASKDYTELSDDEKLGRLKKDLLDARQASRILFIFEHPEMIDRMLELRKE